MTRLIEILKVYGTIFALFIIVLYGKNINIYADTIEVKTPQHVKAVKASKASIKLSWKGNSEADYYQIYRYNQKSKKFIKIHSLKNHKKQVNITWTNGKLKTNRHTRFVGIAVIQRLQQ